MLQASTPSVSPTTVKQGMEPLSLLKTVYGTWSKGEDLDVDFVCLMAAYNPQPLRAKGFSNMAG